MKHKNYLMIPTGFEIIWNLLLAISFLGWVNYSRILRYFKNNDPVLSTDVELFKIPSLEILNSHIVASIVTFLFWSCVGLAAYVLGTIFISMLSDAGKATSLTEHYIFPDEHSKQKYKLVAANHIIIRILGIAGFITWLIIFFTKIIPTTSIFFYVAITQDRSLIGIGSAVMSAIALAAYMFIGTILTRLVALRIRVFNSN